MFGEVDNRPAVMSSPSLVMSFANDEWSGVDGNVPGIWISEIVCFVVSVPSFVEEGAMGLACSSSALGMTADSLASMPSLTARPPRQCNRFPRR